MANGKQRQALAISARLSTGVIPGYGSSEVEGISASMAALEREAAKFYAAGEAGRMNGGASGHIVIDAGRLSGFVKDAHTTVRFAGGSVAVTTHD